jgi:hypothetical protein
MIRRYFYNPKEVEGRDGIKPHIWALDANGFPLHREQAHPNVGRMGLKLAENYILHIRDGQGDYPDGWVQPRMRSFLGFKVWTEDAPFTACKRKIVRLARKTWRWARERVRRAVA